MPTGIKINTTDVSKAAFVLLCAPYDRSASFRKGASRGPASIVSSLKYQMETFDRFTGTMPSPHRTVALRHLEKLNSFTPDEMVCRVRKEYAQLFRPETFVVLLGGEHSVTTGALQAVAEARDAGKITVFQIDAHLDLRDDDADYSDAPSGRYAHCTVMRRAHELGFKCVNVGARAYSMDEINYAHEHDIAVFEWGKGNIVTPQTIVKAIPTSDVYLTIDVDGIDPAHMPATGTPVQGGLEWYYTMDCIREIYMCKNVIGCDVVEVAPRPHDVVTEYGAAQLCYTMIALREICGHS